MNQNSSKDMIDTETQRRTLEALVVEEDLPNELPLGPTEAGFDSLPSDVGTRGVPGGVRSLKKQKDIDFG